MIKLCQKPINNFKIQFVQTPIILNDFQKFEQKILDLYKQNKGVKFFLCPENIKTSYIYTMRKKHKIDLRIFSIDKNFMVKKVFLFCGKNLLELAKDITINKSKLERFFYSLPVFWHENCHNLNEIKIQNIFGFTKKSSEFEFKGQQVFKNDFIRNKKNKVKKFIDFIK